MPRITGPSVAGQSPARDMYIGRIGSALTPRRIASIMALADTGQVAAWHDLMNEVRQKDGALHSVLQTRETALLSAGWTVSAFVATGQREAKKRDERVAAFCQDALSSLCGFERGLAHLLDATYKGFSVCEVQWSKRSDGKIVPVALTPVQGRRWHVEEDQRITLSDDGSLVKRLDVIGDNPGRFILHTPRVNGDQVAREGLGRILVWYSAFGTWGWRDWMLFAELFGKPSRHVEYDPEHYQGDTDDAVKEALDAMLSSGYGIFPKGAKLLTEWPAGGKGGSSPAGDIIERAAEWMALAALGQRATVSQVTNGLGGSGDARDLVRKDIVDADNKAIGETIRDQLLVPLVAMNFGPKAVASFFGFDTQESADLKAFGDGVSVLKDAGLKIPTAYVYDVTGIPRPVADEETLGEESADDAAEDAAEVDKPEPQSEPIGGTPDGAPEDETNTDE